MIFLLLILILFIFYSCLVLFYWQAWKKVPLFYCSAVKPATRVSVIIPARNEAKEIANLLIALQHQDYPIELMEIIVIDDHSTDDTAAIVKQFAKVKLVQLKEDTINSYKKKAIEKGIAHATGELVITTDADCIPPKNWIQTVVDFREKNNSVFVAAPVVMDCNNSILQVFQAMDFMVLQVITGAGVYHKKITMCNGANIAYQKQVFDKVGGFAGIDSIASGDDMLLMHKIWQQYPDKVHYLKSPEAIVATQPMKTWKGFINQRIRWASKARKYEDKRIFPVLLLVYLFNLSFAVLAIAGIFLHQYWYYLLLVWLAKTLVEFPLFYTATIFFNKKRMNWFFFFFQPLHILYTILSGLLGQFGTFEWKGRKVK